MARNVLYFGDNLDILRRHLGDESVDLIYLDPPFKSNQKYRARNTAGGARRKPGNGSSAETGNGKSRALGISQPAAAFEDVWRWDEEAQAAFDEILASGGQPSYSMQGLRLILGCDDMLAYLTMMAPRLLELHRVLKVNGSLYLHCDTSSSHYLKVLLDSIFGANNFRNEIVWHYGGRGAKAIARQFPRNHDAILFYSKKKGSHRYQRLNTVRLFTRKDAASRGFRQDELGRWYKTAPRGDYTDESLRRLEEEGRIHRTKTGRVRIKYFLREDGPFVAEDVQVDDTWTSIADGMHLGDEHRGYPTQKPEALIERILEASSDEGEVVLDPFCGSGTTLVVAQRLHRQWIGIENSRLAIELSQSRLAESTGDHCYTCVDESGCAPGQTL